MHLLRFPGNHSTGDKAFLTFQCLKELFRYLAGDVERTNYFSTPISDANFHFLTEMQNYETLTARSLDSWNLRAEITSIPKTVLQQILCCFPFQPSKYRDTVGLWETWAYIPKCGIVFAKLHLKAISFCMF